MEIGTSTAEELVMMERIARIVSSVRGAKTDYTPLAAELEHAVSFDIFGVVLLRHDHEAVRVMVCQRASQGWTTAYHQRPYRDSLLERMCQKPVPIVRNYPNGVDGLPVESGDALSQYHHLYSTLIVPLMVEDNVLGTLELGSVTPYAYRDDALIRLVTAVARVLATAIEGVQLGGNAAIQDRQREVLKDVTSALTTPLDLSAVLQRIAGGIAEALDVAACLLLIDQSRKRWRWIVHSELDASAVERVFAGEIVLSEKEILGKTLILRQKCSSNDIACDERFPESRVLHDVLGLRSIISVPLFIESTIHGVFFLGTSDTGGFTPLKADILALFANQATVAIHNSLLLDAREKRQLFFEAVEHLEQSLQQEGVQEEHFATDTDLVLLKRVREETQRTFGVSFSVLLRFMTAKLPLLSEHALSMGISTDQQEEPFSLRDMLEFPTDMQLDAYISSPEKRIVREGENATGPDSETFSLLTQTTQTSLTQVAMLRAFGRLLMELKQSANLETDAWFLVDLQGRCMYVNRAAESLCNLHYEATSSLSIHQLSAMQVQAGDHVQQIFARLLPCMHKRQHVLAYLQELAQGNSYRQELRFDLASKALPSEEADGVEGQHESLCRDSHYLLRSYPLLDTQDQLESTAIQVQNITEQVRDEKNRFFLLSAVNHDLRTPLTTIKAAVTGLMETKFPWSAEDVQEMLADIDEETDHLTELVSNLVELSRIEMGALTVEKTWCDVEEIAYGAIARIDGSLLAHKPVKVNILPQSPLIWCDHVQLQNVFFHLVKNALQRSPVQATIDVVMKISERQKKLFVDVIDGGQAIPAEECPHIFETFKSLSPHGNGMGLAICKGLIAALQGQIWVETTGDAHTSFAFTIPTHPPPRQTSVAETAGETESKYGQDARSLRHGLEFQGNHSV